MYANMIPCHMAKFCCMNWDAQKGESFYPSSDNGVIKFWGSHENGDPGSPFHYDFGDSQHNSLCVVDTRRFSAWHEFRSVI